VENIFGKCNEIGSLIVIYIKGGVKIVRRGMQTLENRLDTSVYKHIEGEKI